MKKYRDKDGKEIIEETRIGKNGEKTFKKQVILENGMVEETLIDKHGNVIKNIRK